MEVTLIVILPVLWVHPGSLRIPWALLAASRWIRPLHSSWCIWRTFPIVHLMPLAANPSSFSLPRETTLSFVKHVMLKHPGQKLAAVDRYWVVRANLLQNLLPSCPPALRRPQARRSRNHQAWVTEYVETPMNPGIGEESEPNAPHNL